MKQTRWLSGFSRPSEFTRFTLYLMLGTGSNVFCVADFTPGVDGIPSLCDNATELGIAAREKCRGSLSYIRTDWEQFQTCK